MSPRHLARVAGAVWLLATLAGSAIQAQPFPAASATGDDVRVSIQLVNPEAQTSVRLMLDGRLVFDGRPEHSSLPNIPTLPAQFGPFALAAGGMHRLVADAPATGTKAALEWQPQRDGSAWVVVRFYPGRGDSANPPFFTLALQARPQMLH